MNNISEDILYHIYSYIGYFNIIILSQTCKYLHIICNNHINRKISQYEYEFIYHNKYEYENVFNYFNIMLSDNNIYEKLKMLKSLENHEISSNINSEQNLEVLKLMKQFYITQDINCNGIDNNIISQLSYRLHYETKYHNDKLPQLMSYFEILFHIPWEYSNINIYEFLKNLWYASYTSDVPLKYIEFRYNIITSWFKKDEEKHSNTLNIFHFLFKQNIENRIKIYGIMILFRYYIFILLQQDSNISCDNFDYKYDQYIEFIHNNSNYLDKYFKTQVFKTFTKFEKLYQKKKKLF